MKNLTAISYFMSLLFYGMGLSKIMVLKSVVIEHVDTYDYTLNVSLTTGYLVLAIIFTIIGSTIFYYKNYIMQIKAKSNIQSVKEVGWKMNNKRQSSLLDVKDQITHSQYVLDRRMSS